MSSNQIRKSITSFQKNMTCIGGCLLADPACATSGGWNHSHSHSHRLVVVGVVVFTVLSIVTAAVVTLLCVLLRSTVKGRYGSDISLGLYLSADKLLPTSERIPPQVYGEFVTIQQLVTAAFYGVGKVIKYLMRSVTKTNEGQHYHSDTVVPIALQLSHRNLLRVRQCIAGDEDEDFLLVYEYMPNGRLSDYLLKPERHLTWSMRYVLMLYLAFSIIIGQTINLRETICFCRDRSGQLLQALLMFSLLYYVMIAG